MTNILSQFDLKRFLEQISAKIGLGETAIVNRPIEAAHLKALPGVELHAASARNGLNVVRRLSGLVFEFTRRAST